MRHATDGAGFEPADVAAPTEVIFIGGRSGVGKTTVAAAASRLLAVARIRHAVIEGDALDQGWPEPWRAGVDLAERNLAAMWRNYRAIGFTRLLYTNTVSVLQLPSLTAALGGTVDAVAVLLTAEDATAGQRLARRETGASLNEHIDRSADAAALLDAADAVVHRVETDGRLVDDIARDVLRLAGWALPSDEHGPLPR